MLILSGIIQGNSLFPQESNNTNNGIALKKVREELIFISHLEGRQNYRDALFLLRGLSQMGLPGALIDSVNYKIGWNYYSMKILDSSSYYLFQVSEKSDLFLKARFFGAYNTLFAGEKGMAKSYFKSIQVPARMQDSLELPVKQLISLELAGIALLERDYQAFRSEVSKFTYEYYPLAAEQKNLIRYEGLLQSFKPKSPWLAGIMSAMVPGSGKIYAGKTGEGIAGFLVVACLGLVGWENYNKDGLLDWKTLMSGGIFTIYYTGNILGSAKAAQRHNHAYTQALDNRILFDLHIPLRNIFN
ncbi:MAG: hypothetical protein AB9842_01985 [Bacteroidales bacterium]